MDVHECAKLLNIDPATVRQRIRNNKIKAIKIGNKYKICKKDIQDSYYSFRFITPEEASIMTNKSISTIRNWYKKKYFIYEKTKKNIYINKHSFLAFLKRKGISYSESYHQD